MEVVFFRVVLKGYGGTPNKEVSVACCYNVLCCLPSISEGNLL